MKSSPPPGRGATRSPAPRYLKLNVLPDDDGWGSADEPVPERQTTVTPEVTRNIISSNTSPDVSFNRSINPYKGCEHGCIYCFARPTHAYLDLSPGLDFETRITSKPDAARLLRHAFQKKGYQPQVIALGVNTDAYQPAERRLGITRQLLEVFREFQHPVGLITKSALVMRDLDILADLAAQGLTHVFLSITSLDRTLARRMEPRAATPERRLETVRHLAAAGIPVGVMMAPLIPAVNDGEIEALLEACAAAGAHTAGYVLVRLPLEIKELFEGWLDTHFPDRKERVLKLIRDCRGGQLYQAEFGTRMSGTGPYAQLLGQRFELAARRFGLDGNLPRLDTSKFRVPPAPPAPGQQLSLL